jgi:hypothetical protein
MAGTTDGKSQTMILRSTLLIIILVLLAYSSEGQANGNRTCGMKLGDWCPSYHGDSCNRHKTSDACRADAKCYGMPCRGESLIACMFDARGFASNCPTIGCTSRLPKR